jgi:hypothetical protein
MATADNNDGRIFVFGSNLSGIHGGGAAHFAHKHRGALWGQGVGLQGQSYALPTKDENIETLPISEVEKHVKKFKKFAKEHPEFQFEVTRVGCGLAGFTDSQIAPLFRGSPKNCDLPEGW